MLVFFLFFFSLIIRNLSGQHTTIYVKQGDVAELCDNRSTSIYAYEYRSLDGTKDSILEPSKDDRYSNPYHTSLLRINNVNENDSGSYKCPQDDIEWQELQVYVPVQHVYLSNLRTPSSVRQNELCGIDNRNCLVMVEGEPLDIVCASDGYPRPALDILFDGNGTVPTIMALATGAQMPSFINNEFKPSVYEVYRIPKLTSSDHGRNITCRVDMKHIDKKLILSTTKQLYIDFRPTVVPTSLKVLARINHTTTINCTILRANPFNIQYTISGLPPSIIQRNYTNANNSCYSVEIMPTSIEHFQPFTITAHNSIGHDTCTYQLLHGGSPDPITHCEVDTRKSNTTFTITCTKSYSQGDDNGYTCILYKYNKDGPRMFEDIAQIRSCIFVLETSHEPVEYRVAARNRHGAGAVNTESYVIRLNQPVPKESFGFNRKFFVIIISICGGAILFCFMCCLCGTCHQDRTSLSHRNNIYQKDKYPRSSIDNEALKPINDDNLSHLSSNGNDKRHMNGAVYDIPIHLNGKYSHQMSSPTSAYHQQKSHQSSNIHYVDQDSISSSISSIPTRARTFNNKFYGNPLIESKYGPLSSMKRGNPNKDDIIENDEEEDESPVYSTTTDVMSESGSFLVPASSSKRRAPPPPKPRYSTLSSIRIPLENSDKHPLPLPKPRSRSNSRTRLNNGSSDNSSYLYEEHPVSSSDSGMGQSDVVCLPNGDTIRSGLVKSRQNSLQKHCVNSPFFQQPIKTEPLTTSIPRGTEC